MGDAHLLGSERILAFAAGVRVGAGRRERVVRRGVAQSRVEIPMRRRSLRNRHLRSCLQCRGGYVHRSA
jgi:hypothetical protein